MAREYGRDALDLRDLVSLILPENAPSIALALRLGATAGEPIEFLGQPCLLYRHPPAAGAKGRVEQAMLDKR